MENITDIITVYNNTNDVKNEKNEAGIYIIYLLLTLLGLLIIGMIIGIQECARTAGYNNFIECFSCEIVDLFLSCFVGSEKSSQIIRKCLKRRVEATSDSDSESEYNEENETIIKIEPSIMFESDIPKKYSEESEDNKVCSICCETLEYQEEENEEKKINIVELECNHFYHSKCIESWYQASKNKDCPMCKKEIKVNGYYYV